MTTGQGAPPAHDQTRLYSADKLKVALTMLVIAHHSAQPYGATGGAWPIHNAQHSQLLLPFFAVNAAFFMGLFFLISGFFVPQSYDHKGAAGFLKTRLVRLGIPVAFFALFLAGPINFLGLFEPGSISTGLFGESGQYAGLSGWAAFTAFLGFLYDRAWTLLYGPLWFLLHLLLYGLIYVLWRKYRTPAPSGTARPGGPPSNTQIVAYLLALAGVTWVVRIWYPVDHWVPLFFLIPAEPAHFPQYLSLFLFGVLAARRDWPHAFPARQGMLWLRVGLIAGGLCYLYWLVGRPYLPGLIAKGGLSWQSMVWCLWEAAICLGMCVGLTVWFRERWNQRPGGFARGLIVAAYGAYIIHIFIVITLQADLQASPLPPLVKFAVVTAAGVAISFALSYALRYIPGVTKVL